MTICKRCLETFDDDEIPVDTPATELGDIFLSDMGYKVADICPKCREFLGLANITSFLF